MALVNYAIKKISDEDLEKLFKERDYKTSRFQTIETIVNKIRKKEPSWVFAEDLTLGEYDPQKDKKLRWKYKNTNENSETNTLIYSSWEYYKSQKEYFKEIGWGIRQVRKFCKCISKHAFIYLYNNSKKYWSLDSKLGQIQVVKKYNMYNLFDKFIYYSSMSLNYRRALTKEELNGIPYRKTIDLQFTNISRLVNCNVIGKVLNIK